MILKAGTRPYGLRPELLLGLLIVEGIYKDNDYQFVVTSLCDGKHSRGSLHYVGAAADIRHSMIPEDERQGIANQARGVLGGDYDFVLEATHFHCEYQPNEHY